jgi:hypothetical protein
MAWSHFLSALTIGMLNQRKGSLLLSSLSLESSPSCAKYHDITHTGRHLDERGRHPILFVYGIKQE